MAKNAFKKVPEAAPEVVKEEPKPAEEKKVKKKKKQKVKSKTESKKPTGNFLKGILDGSILTKGFVIKSIPMILLLVFIGIVFIANRYQIEKKSLKINKLNKELQSLQIQHIETKQGFMEASKLTEISKLLDSIGIQQSTDRPQKIVLQKK